MRYCFIFTLLIVSFGLFAQETIWTKSVTVEEALFEFRVAPPSESSTILRVIKNGEVAHADTLLHEFKQGSLEDFNQDGHLDFFATWRSYGGIEWRHLYLYDPLGKTYKEVKMFQYFFNAKPVPDQPKAYYSYEGTYCEGAVWNSQLFVIEDFEAVMKARINANDCERIREKDMTVEVPFGPYNYWLTERIPVDTLNKIEGHKWGFMEAYWKQKAQEYLKP